MWIQVGESPKCAGRLALSLLRSGVEAGLD
jgi:hypothetical protein